MDQPHPILIVACGNTWAGDDAAGVVAGRLLQRLKLPGVEVISFVPTAGAILELLPGRQALWVLDAIRLEGADVGEIVEVDWLALKEYHAQAGSALAGHGWSIADELRLAASMRLLPEQVRILGVVIGEATPMAPMGRAVRHAAVNVARRIRSWIQARSAPAETQQHTNAPGGVLC